VAFRDPLSIAIASSASVLGGNHFLPGAMSAFCGATKKKCLTDMERVVPWSRLIAAIE